MAHLYCTDCGQWTYHTITSVGPIATAINVYAKCTTCNTSRKASDGRIELIRREIERNPVAASLI